MSIPYVGFSNETLNSCPRVKEGDLIKCPQCGDQHAIEFGTSNGKKSDAIGFYRCGDSTYLGAVAGRLVIGKSSDVSGDL